MMKERSVKHDRHGLVSLSCYTWSEYVYFSFVHVDNLISRCDLPTPLLHSNNTTAVICGINITITNCIQLLYLNQIRFDKFSSHDSTVNKLVCNTCKPFLLCQHLNILISSRQIQFVYFNQ